MSPSSPSRSRRKADKIDVSYEVEMPFESRSAFINLIVQGDEVEIIISQIPVPSGFHMNSATKADERAYQDKHAVARWILKDAASVLDTYDWDHSTSRSNKPNHYLRDVYFSCDRADVDDAVMAAKRFLTELEAHVLRHSREFDVGLRDPPSEVLTSD